MCESFRENYLVRIYRRDAEDPERITGLVEFIEAGEKKAFATFDELKSILDADREKSGQKIGPHDDKRRSNPS